MIETLIDKRDTAEVVRDRIVEILVTEVAAQKALASSSSQDPAQWDLRIFADRSNAWSLLVDAPASALPIVNVTWDGAVFDKTASNVVERQKALATYHIDCIGYGVSEASSAGHAPGDARAAAEVQRAVRLVRNILMAAEHTYLGLRGVVWRRWVASIQMFQPELENSVVQQVVGARLAIEVEFNEFSPQVQGAPLEWIGSTVYRAETGEVLLRTDHAHPDPDS